MNITNSTKIWKLRVDFTNPWKSSNYRYEKIPLKVQFLIIPKIVPEFPGNLQQWDNLKHLKIPPEIKTFNQISQKPVKINNQIIQKYLLQIQLSFPFFGLDKPNDCDSNFVDIFPEETDILSRWGIF